MAVIVSASADRGAGPLHVGLGDKDPRRREPGPDRRDHVLLGGRLAAGDEADTLGEQRQRAFALEREQAFPGELLAPAVRGRTSSAPAPHRLDRSAHAGGILHRGRARAPARP